MDRGALQAPVHGVAKSPVQLSMQAHMPVWGQVEPVERLDQGAVVGGRAGRSRPGPCPLGESGSRAAVGRPQGQLAPLCALHGAGPGD